LKLILDTQAALWWLSGDERMGTAAEEQLADVELAHLHPDSDAAARLYARIGFVETPGFDVYVDL
jgi:hypothetical protein